jgi:hypothetical protein
MASTRAHNPGTPSFTRPRADAEEAAAIIAALERFIADTGGYAATGAGPRGIDPWQSAALLEGVSRKGAPLAPTPWMT